MMMTTTACAVTAMCTEGSSAAAPSGPLGFLRLHHRIQDGICAALSLIANDLHHHRIADRAAVVADYLLRELPLHQAHETMDLPEALEIGKGAPANILGLFELMSSAHARDYAMARKVTDDLSLLACGRFPAEPLPFVISLLQLAESLRRHIAWEERVMLPFAADALYPEGRAVLTRKMAVRRRETLSPTGGQVP